MGNYLTQADLLRRFDADDEAAYLTGDGDTGVPNSDKLDDAIEAGESHVDLRLAARYATPVSSSDAATTATVKRLATDSAEYWYRSRKRQGISEDTQRMKTDLDAELEAIAEGKFALPGAAVPESTTSMVEADWIPGNATRSDDSDRLFTRDSAARL